MNNKFQIKMSLKKYSNNPLVNTLLLVQGDSCSGRER
jgi:hypothetical protein